MQKPLEITFRHMDPSPAMENAVRDQVEKLEQYCSDIVGCSVALEFPHEHHRQGNLFHIRIDLTLPGKEIVVRRSPDDHHAHEDPYVALHNAFDALQRQVEDYVRIRRGQIKNHEQAPRGRVFMLEPERDFGRLETPEGDDIYFHRNSLVNADFDDLKLGTELRFTEEAGQDGPQATSVYVVGKRRRTR